MKQLQVDAHQWFKIGDHPDDRTDGGESRVVRYFRRPEREYAGELVHETCGRTWHDHGWLDTGGEGDPVCPGDWVCLITGVDGEDGVIGDHFACKPSTFADMYEEIPSTVAEDPAAVVEQKRSDIARAAEWAGLAVADFVIGATPNLDYLPSSTVHQLIVEATIAYLVAEDLIKVVSDEDAPFTLKMRVPTAFVPDTAGAARRQRELDARAPH